MRIFLGAPVLLLLAACGDSTRPPAAAEVTLTMTAAPLDAIGAAVQVVAVVRDANGSVMENGVVIWTSSNANATVVAMDTSSRRATITAAATGDATITARSGEATASVSVTVTQTVAGFTAEGSGQSGTVDAPLPSPLVVRVTDRLGTPIAGHDVTFSVAGGGRVSAASVPTAADGTARIEWTLGKLVSEPQRVTALAGLFTRHFVATPRGAAPSAMKKVAGDGQSWYVNSAVPVRPAVLVTDIHGNGVAGADVTFTATNSSVTGAVQVTDGAGIATVGSWVLGNAGAASVTATAVAAGASATFNGTAQSSSPPVVVAVTGPVMQAAVEGREITALPAVRLADQSGTPVAGRRVTFTVTGGGGTTADATATSDANGIATMSSWTLGGVAGPNTVTATVDGLAVSNNNPVFTAIGCTGGGSTAGFTINVCFTTPVTDAQRMAFVNAAARWGSVITGDVSDFPFSLASPNCGAGAPALHLTIDDLLIFARIEPIDGVGQILGSAGWCYRRTGGLPLVGLMRFDEADVAGLVATDRFGDIILHEMGHVLGIGGSMWSTMGFLQNPGSSQSGAPLFDTHFTGVHAIVGFDQIGGLSYTGGAKVPVQNTGAAGSINSHWRESVLGNELMSPFLNTGSNPLTVLTVLSLRDLGYEVDPTHADQSSMSQLHEGGPVRGAVLDLSKVMLDVPKQTIDRNGRVQRVHQ
ncbi:MAG: hypothetical protein H0X64_01020 [Gemmatimonadaceae bacterium]|nr:hypothetical protein [Gemmatimonadaceae bacterium]